MSDWVCSVAFRCLRQHPNSTPTSLRAQLLHLNSIPTAQPQHPCAHSHSTPAQLWAAVDCVRSSDGHHVGIGHWGGADIYDLSTQQWKQHITEHTLPVRQVVTQQLVTVLSLDCWFRSAS